MDNYYDDSVKCFIMGNYKNNYLPFDCINIVYNNIISNIIEKYKDKILNYDIDKNISDFELNIFRKYNNVIIDINDYMFYEYTNYIQYIYDMNVKIIYNKNPVEYLVHLLSYRDIETDIVTDEDNDDEYPDISIKNINTIYECLIKNKFDKEWNNNLDTLKINIAESKIDKLYNWILSKGFDFKMYDNELDIYYTLTI